MRTTLLAATIAVMAASTLAPVQWLHYPTADVPRTADGKPNLAAPAPRLPGGKPDFSGIWQSARKVACTPEMSRFIDCGAEIGGSPLAMDIGADLPGGLPYQPWAAALVKQRTADNSKDDPHARCLPDNPPRPYGLPHMTKAVHTPRRVVLLNEGNAMYRQLFLDARPLPARQPAAALRAAAHDESRAHAATAGAAQRSERHVPADLHRRRAAARGPHPVVERLLDRGVGGRHAGGAHERLPGWPVARHGRQSAHRGRHHDRAVPAAHLRHARGADHR